MSLGLGVPPSQITPRPFSTGFLSASRTISCSKDLQPFLSPEQLNPPSAAQLPHASQSSVCFCSSKCCCFEVLPSSVLSSVPTCSLPWDASSYLMLEHSAFHCWCTNVPVQPVLPPDSLILECLTSARQLYLIICPNVKCSTLRNQFFMSPQTSSFCGPLNCYKWDHYPARHPNSALTHSGRLSPAWPSHQ